MSFQIVEKSLDGLNVIEIKNLSNGEYVNIIPSHGGAINEVVLNQDGRLYPIHKSAKSLQEFEEVSIPMYSGAFLAPFPNRIENGLYQFNGIKHQLKLNDPELPNALHGFLFKSPFSIALMDEKSGIVTLEYHFHGDNGYPFKLFFRNTYQLSEGMLKIGTYARNDSGNIAPFGLGWHPYISTTTSVDLLYLKIPGKRTFVQNDHYIPIGRIVENTRFKELAIISNRFMNDCYELENGNQTIVYDPKNNLEIIIKQQTGIKAYNYCMYYTPPARDCLAVEPMTAVPNAFNNGHGLIVLAHNEAIALQFSLGLNGSDPNVKME